MFAIIRAAVLSAVVASPALAQESQLTQPPPTVGVRGETGLTETPHAESRLSSADMSALSGGQGVNAHVLTHQSLSGLTSGNSIEADTIQTGDVSFSPDALGGFAGVGNFVINTGANNTLQGAINISIVTVPGI